MPNTPQPVGSALYCVPHRIRAPYGIVVIPLNHHYNSFCWMVNCECYLVLRYNEDQIVIIIHFDMLLLYYTESSPERLSMPMARRMLIVIFKQLLPKVYRYHVLCKTEEYDDNGQRRKSLVCDGNHQVYEYEITKR